MVSNGNITAISLQLEKAGLISRNTSRQDRRSTFIKMTTKGKKAFAKMETAYNQWLSELLAQLPESAKTRLYQSLAEGKEAVTKAVEESKVDA